MRLVATPSSCPISLSRLLHSLCHYMYHMVCVIDTLLGLVKKEAICVHSRLRESCHYRCCLAARIVTSSMILGIMTSRFLSLLSRLFPAIHSGFRGRRAVALLSLCSVYPPCPHVSYGAHNYHSQGLGLFSSSRNLL